MSVPRLLVQNRSVFHLTRANGPRLNLARPSVPHAVMMPSAGHCLVDHIRPFFHTCAGLDTEEKNTVLMGENSLTFV